MNLSWLEISEGYKEAAGHKLEKNFIFRLEGQGILVVTSG